MKIINIFKYDDKCFVEYISDKYKNYLSFNFNGTIIKHYPELELLYDADKVSENYTDHFNTVKEVLMFEIGSELTRKVYNGAGIIDWVDYFRNFIESFVKYFLKDYENFDYSQGKL